MRESLTNLHDIWKQIGLNQKITLAVAITGILSVMVALVLWSNRPQYQLLYGNLSPQDAASVVEALESQGVLYQIQAGGSAIHVPGDQVHRMRMDLVSKGIPAGDSIGYEIFDRSSFGVSDFVQRTNYIRAVQGELARTISQLNGVRSARVMVVMPENRLLLVNPNAVPTASVLVELGARVLDNQAVHSIRSLVANSVEGLQVENVAVVDNRGRVLSDQLREEDASEGSVASVRHRQKVESYLTEKVESMLTTVLGSNQAVVRVSAEIEYDAQTITEERFDPDGQVVRSQSSTEESSRSRESRPGPAAAIDDPNQPAQPATEIGSDTDRNQKTRRQDYEIGRSLINTVRQAGEVRSVTAAVFIAARRDTSPEGEVIPERTPEELDRLRNMVALTLGIDDRNAAQQLISIEEVPFPLLGTEVTPETFADWQWMDLFGLARDVAPMGLALIFFLFLLHQLRRSRVEATIVGPHRHEGSAMEEKGAVVSPEVLNELIRQKPENVGSALRNWAVPRRNG